MAMNVAKTAVQYGHHGHIVLQHVVSQQNRDCDIVLIAIQVAKQAIILSASIYLNARRIVMNFVPIGQFGHSVLVCVVKEVCLGLEHVQLIAIAI